MSQSNTRRRASPFSMERLENRQLLSVDVDGNGFTIVTPSADTRKIYVSSSFGNDNNSGLSPVSPVKTIAKGESLLRDGMPDWLLLKRGDTWNEGLTNQWNDWQKSGRSTDEPLLVSAYGRGARPLLKTGPFSGIFTLADAENYVDIMGIEFYADTRDPNSPSYTGDTTGLVGMNFLTNGNSYSWLIEDCKISFYNAGIVFAGSFHDITIRRNIIVDSYSTTAHSSGIYAGNGTLGLTIEENVLDHNGWNEQIAGAEATIFNHNIYLAEATKGVVVRYNIIANASSHGLQARGGGHIYGNLFINNPIGVLVAIGQGGTGYGDYVNDNVFVGSATINGMRRGNAIDINGANNLTISGNIAYSSSQSSGGGINVHDAEGINGLTIENNIVHGWYRAMTFDPTLIPGGVGTHALNGVTIRNNKYSAIYCAQVIDHYGAYSPSAESWQGNTYSDINDPSGWFTIQGVSTSLNTWLSTIDRTGSSVPPTYADPTRNIATYNATLGGTGTDNAFLAQARLQSWQNWRTPYTAQAAIRYILEGFYKAGDANRDGNVGIADYIVMLTNFGKTEQDWSTGDFNGDGLVTISDWIDLASNYNVLS